MRLGLEGGPAEAMRTSLTRPTRASTPPANADNLTEPRPARRLHGTAMASVVTVRRVLAFLPLFLLALASCSDQASVEENDALSYADTPARSAGVAHYALAHFEGAFDPETGIVTIEVMHEPSVDGLREPEMPLYRVIRRSNERTTPPLRNGSGGVFATLAMRIPGDVIDGAGNGLRSWSSCVRISRPTRSRTCTR